MDDIYQPIIGNVIIYRDNRHITNTYSKTFGPIIEKQITEILKEND